MLKLGTIDLYNAVRLAEQYFGGSFNHPCFSGTGRPQEQHCSDRPLRVIHPGQIYLEKATKATNAAFLAYDKAGKLIFEFFCTRALSFGIQKDPFVRSRFFARRFVLHLPLSLPGSRKLAGHSANRMTIIKHVFAILLTANPS